MFNWLYVATGSAVIIGLLGWMLLKSHEANGSLEARIGGYKASNIALAESVEKAVEEKRLADEVTAKAKLRSRALQGRLDVLIKDYDKLGEEYETVKEYYSITIPPDVLSIMCKGGRCERGISPESSTTESSDDGSSSSETEVE